MFFSWAVRFLVAVVVCAGIGGCAASAKVTDLNKNITSVTNITLSDSGKFRIYDGFAVINVSAHKLKRIQIQPDITKLYDRELFCLAEIEFSDGTRIGSFSKDQQKAYLAAGQYLHGETPGGTFRILLSHVEKIEFTN